MRKFDLNIDKILEDWNVEHAIREIIANAIDEQTITNTRDIVIEKKSEGIWSIKDFGRGIRYEHFVQNESLEKQRTKGIIGKFGIGLKDALATFDRKGVSVEIFSQYGDIKVRRISKGGFDDIVTLHAIIEDPSRPNMIGTEFILSGISDGDIKNAKNYFLRFSNSIVLSKTSLGEIIKKDDYSPSFIYVNGVKIASEDNFLFSYNITSINASLKKALNRERSNVGRTAYTPSVRAMLLESIDETVIDLLSKDFREYASGKIHDELKWQDVQMHATKLLNKRENVVFVTSSEMLAKNDLVHEAERSSHIIVIPDNLQVKINQSNEEANDTNAEKINTMEVFTQKRNENFEYKFIDKENLSSLEFENYKYIDKILNAIGGKPDVVKEILISEKMQDDIVTFAPADGLWTEGKIIIKRSVLSRLERFIGVLLHELAHAKSGYTDATREFETQLTDFLGVLGAKYIRTL